MNLHDKFYNILKDQIAGGSVVLIKGEDEFKYHYGYSSLNDKKLVDDETILGLHQFLKLLL